MKSIALKRTLTLLFYYTPLALFWMIGWLTIHPYARRRSRQQLPAVLQDLGLSPPSGAFQAELETIEGQYNGHAVKIEPEEATVSLRYHRWKTVEINDQKAYHPTREDLQDFTSGDELFDSIFKTRRVQPQDVVLFNANGKLPDAVVSFYMRWLWHIKHFRIDDHGLQCRLNCGFPFSPHIPAPYLEPLLCDLSELVITIESALADKDD